MWTSAMDEIRSLYQQSRYDSDTELWGHWVKVQVTKGRSKVKVPRAERGVCCRQGGVGVRRPGGSLSPGGLLFPEHSVSV